MVRRSFRIGLRLGLLAGATFALVKTVRSRLARGDAPTDPPRWEPIAPETFPRDEVGEPILEPTAPEEEEDQAEDETIADDMWEEDDDPARDLPSPAFDVPVELEEPEAPAPPPKPIRPRRGPAARSKTKPASATWVAPDDEGVCPTTHPVKAKLKSRLFHLPGMFAYERTRADRCYRDADGAVADGFTSAKR